MRKTKQRIYDTAYSENGQYYESGKGVLSFLQKKLTKYLVSRYKVCYDLLSSKGGIIVDVGCGNGYFLLMTQKKFEKCIGIDISKVRIKKATEAVNKLSTFEKFEFIVRDVDEGLPMSSESINTVTCIAVLEHVINPPSLVDEIYRILKPKGEFILEVPNIAWLPYRLQLLLGRLPKTGGTYFGTDWDHLHLFTKSSIIHLLQKKRFKIQKIVCSGVFAGIRNIWVSLLGGDLVIKSIKT